MKKFIITAISICALASSALCANYVADWTAVSPLPGDKIPIGRNKDGTDKAITVQSIQPMTTAGDIIYGGASGAPTRLGIGTNGYYLTVVSGAPAWTALPTFQATLVSGTNIKTVGGITLLGSGDLGTLAASYIGNVTNSSSHPLTGYTSGAGTVAATDTVLGAIQKLAGNDALKLPLAGGTMSGAIAMGSNRVTGLGAATTSGDAVQYIAASTAPTLFTFSAAGSKTAYAWAKDAAGNVSAPAAASVIITSGKTRLKPGPTRLIKGTTRLLRTGLDSGMIMAMTSDTPMARRAVMGYIACCLAAHLLPGGDEG